MSALRLRVLRSVVRPTVSRTAPRTSRTQLVARRYASSGGHGAHEASSDLPWAIGAGIVTPVGAYFLWPSASTHAEHGHHDAHGEEHEEHAEGEEVEEKSEEADDAKEAESKDEESKDEESNQEEESKAGEPTDEASKDDESKDKESKDDSAEKEPKDDAKDDAGKEDKKSSKPSGSEGEGQPKSDDSNKKSSGDEKPSEPTTKSGESNVSGVKGKGHMKADAPGNTNEVKSEPDGKGGFKKRMDSGAQKDLGDAAANPQGDIAKKQAGLSNTPTRHSTDIHNSDEKSKKSEGVPDTAKINGPVDPFRAAK